MNDTELGEIRERAAKATPGPWQWSSPDVVYMTPADATFISTARTDIPLLLAEVDRLNGQIADAWDEGHAAPPDGYRWETTSVRRPDIRTRVAVPTPNPYRSVAEGKTE